jgi:hypothetical protein
MNRKGILRHTFASAVSHYATWPVKIERRRGHLHSIIMDVPPVCKVAEEYIQASGLIARFTLLHPLIQT